MDSCTYDMTMTRRVKNDIMRLRYHHHHKSRTTSLLFMVKNKYNPLKYIHAKNAFIIYVAYFNIIPSPEPYYAPPYADRPPCFPFVFLSLTLLPCFNFPLDFLAIMVSQNGSFRKPTIFNVKIKQLTSGPR